MRNLCFLLSSTHSTQFASGAANLSSLVLYFHLQCFKVSPCVQSDQKLIEFNEKYLEGISCAMWGSLFPAGLKTPELQSTEHMQLQVSRT